MLVTAHFQVNEFSAFAPCFFCLMQLYLYFLMDVHVGILVSYLVVLGRDIP